MRLGIGKPDQGNAKSNPLAVPNIVLGSNPVKGSSSVVNSKNTGAYVSLQFKKLYTILFSVSRLFE